MRLFMLVLGFSLIVGCAPTEEQLRMEKDLEVMKRRLSQLEIQKAEAAGRQLAGGDALQRDVAELQAGLDNLRVEFQSVNGRLDDLGRDNQQLSDDLQLVKDDTGLQFSALAARVDMLEEQSLTQPPGARPGPAASAPQQQPRVPEETPEQVYQKALDKIRKENKYAEGRRILQEFINKYPEHDLYVNALYWSGEALYGEKNYELAILQLQDVISKYPGHSKAPAAMLKQALAFNALGDAQNARTTMQKLIEDYPDSAQVETAETFLEN